MKKSNKYCVMFDEYYYSKLRGKGFYGVEEYWSLDEVKHGQLIMFHEGHGRFREYRMEYVETRVYPERVELYFIAVPTGHCEWH